MYLIICKSDRTVFGTNHVQPPDGAHNPAFFEVKFWDGPEPPLHNPEEGIESYDPTIGLEIDDPLLISPDERVARLEQHIADMKTRLLVLEKRT